jgi:hypothetical protein
MGHHPECIGAGKCKARNAGLVLSSRFIPFARFVPVFEILVLIYLSKNPFI